jgi:hypothetical protein
MLKISGLLSCPPILYRWLSRPIGYSLIVRLRVAFLDDGALGSVTDIAAYNMRLVLMSVAKS